MTSPPIDIPADQWDVVVGILRRHIPDRDVWAFGSRARWTAKESSDLDLAVVGPEPLTADVRFELTQEFAESNLPIKVDVVDLATLDPPFRALIERDHVIAQHANRSAGPPEGWKSTTLGALCDDGLLRIQAGSRATADNAVGGEVPMVVPRAILDRRIDPSALPKVSRETAASLSRFRLQAGDIVVASPIVRGSVETALVQDPEVGFIAGHGVLIVRIMAHDRIDPRFITQLLNAPASAGWLESNAIGAAVARLNEEILRAFPLTLPPLSEQRAIADVLSILDAKMDLNRRIGETLSELRNAFVPRLISGELRLAKGAKIAREKWREHRS